MSKWPQINVFPVQHRSVIHPDHSHHYCPGSTMSLNRRHLCKHAGSQQGSTNGAGGGEDEGGVSGGGWGDFEDEESEDEDSPLMSWESTCLYENTGWVQNLTMLLVSIISSPEKTPDAAFLLHEVKKICKILLIVIVQWLIYCMSRIFRLEKKLLR